MKVRATVLLLCLLAGPSLASAQHAQVRKGFWIGFGFGYGSLGVNDTDAREGSVTGYLKLGGTLSDKVLLGFESNGWYHSEGGAAVTAASSAATVYFYPVRESGVFLKVGLGIASLTLDLEGSGSDTETGIGALVGAGYDFRVGRNISVTPGVTYFRGDFDAGSTNVFHASVGVTFH